MNTLRDWHPDIEEFIEAKQLEERKAWALIEEGDPSFNGEAYGSIKFKTKTSRFAPPILSWKLPLRVSPFGRAR